MKIKFLLFVLLMLLVLNISSCFKISYSSFGEAYITSEEIFWEHKDEFEKVIEMASRNESLAEVTIKGVISISCKNTEDKCYVVFEIGGSGMLGGQYWSLYYVSDNQPVSELSGVDLIEGPEEECYFQLNKDEHFFYATKRVENNWFFRYMDFDSKQKLA